MHASFSAVSARSKRCAAPTPEYCSPRCAAEVDAKQAHLLVEEDTPPAKAP
jgi:hypothetical protein